MAERTVRVSENTYRYLIEEIRLKGMTADSWIASKLSVGSDVLLPPSDSSLNSLGTLDSEGIALDDSRTKSDAVSDQDALESSAMSLYDEIAEIIESVDCEIDTQDDQKSRIVEKAIEKDDYFGDALIADMRRQGLQFP